MAVTDAEIVAAVNTLQKAIDVTALTTFHAETFRKHLKSKHELDETCAETAAWKTFFDRMAPDGSSARLTQQSFSASMAKGALQSKLPAEQVSELVVKMLAELKLPFSAVGRSPSLSRLCASASQAGKFEMDRHTASTQTELLAAAAEQKHFEHLT